MKKSLATILFISLALSLSCSKATLDPNAPSDTVTYNSHIATLLSTKCNTCHGGSSPSAGLDLTTYSSARDWTENKNLIQRINSTSAPMPPTGLMSAEDRTTFDEWVTDGFPEN